jgi:hypothetical protein
MDWLVHAFIVLLASGAIAGLLYWIAGLLPIPEPIKGWIRVGILICWVLFVIVDLLLPLVTGNPNYRILK